MDFWLHVRLLDFFIFYYKHLVFNCLRQIVQVFRFVYYVFFCVLKDTCLLTKHDSGELRCPRQLLLFHLMK